MKLIDDVGKWSAMLAEDVKWRYMQTEQKRQLDLGRIAGYAAGIPMMFSGQLRNTFQAAAAGKNITEISAMKFRMELLDMASERHLSAGVRGNNTWFLGCGSGTFLRKVDFASVCSYLPTGKTEKKQIAELLWGAHGFIFPLSDLLDGAKLEMTAMMNDCYLEGGSGINMDMILDEWSMTSGPGEAGLRAQ